MFSRTAEAPETSHATIRCDRCGVETTRPELFHKEPRSFSTKVLNVCPVCWEKKKSSGARRRLQYVAALLGFGLLGIALARKQSYGWVMLNLGWLDICLVLALVAHEFAHAFVARAVGFRVFRIIIGTGNVWWRGVIFGFDVEARNVPFTGLVLAAPPEVPGTRWKSASYIAAAPLANGLLAGACYLGLGRPASWEVFGHPFWGWHIFGFANLLVMLATLFPHVGRTPFGAIASDGLAFLKAVFRWSEASAKEHHAGGLCVEAQLCNEQRNFDEARAWTERGLALYPDYELLQRIQAFLFLRAGELEEARVILLPILQRNSQDGEVRLLVMNDIAYVDAHLGREELLDEADRFSREALAGLPWSNALQNTRGGVLLAMSRLDEALPMLRASLVTARDNPDHAAEGQSVLAIAEVRAGNLAAAETALDAARAAEPTCYLIARAEAAIESARREAADAERGVLGA